MKSLIVKRTRILIILQIVTFTVFKFSEHKFWAFSQMGIAPLNFKRVNGLSFFKLMGSGKGMAFSLTPDWSQYALFAVWENEKYCKDFFINNKKLLEYKEKTLAIQTFHLSPIQSKGTWDGNSIFSEMDKFSDYDQPIAVLTRATLRLRTLFSFWKNAKSSTKDLDKSKGLIYSIGVGEAPLIRQATFSIWKNIEALKEFAYQRESHKKIIKLKKEKNWYSEELFARFILLNKFNDTNPGLFSQSALSHFQEINPHSKS